MCLFQSTAYFPEEEEILKHLVEKVSEIQNARVRLDTDIAEKITLIRTLILKAEDNRLFDL